MLATQGWCPCLLLARFVCFSLPAHLIVTICSDALDHLDRYEMDGREISIVFAKDKRKSAEEMRKTTGPIRGIIIFCVITWSLYNFLYMAYFTGRDRDDSRDRGRGGDRDRDRGFRDDRYQMHS